MKRTPSEEHDWERIAASLQHEADNLPAGSEKDKAQVKAAKMKKASEIKNWLLSPGLRPCQNISGDD